MANTYRSISITQMLPPRQHGNCPSARALIRSTNSECFLRDKALCAKARNGKAMQTLHNVLSAGVNAPSTIQCLQQLHPSPPRLIAPLPKYRLPPPPELTDAAVARASRRIPQDITSGPDLMPLRCFHLLASTGPSPAASGTGIGVLTKLVNRTANGELSDTVFPILSAASPPLLQLKPGKISPIAVGFVL